MNSGLGIKLDCLRGCYETDAEGGQKETARRRGVIISGRTGTQPRQMKDAEEFDLCGSSCTLFQDIGHLPVFIDLLHAIF